MPANMKKVAVFGKPGGGKSTLCKTMSTVTGLPLFQLDSIEYAAGEIRVAKEIYLQKHRDILESDHWLIDGLGSLESFRDRIAAADTLIFIDLSLIIHFWWVTKRLILSPFIYPLGFPQGSPILRSTFTSWRNLFYAHRVWTPEFRRKIVNLSASKNVYILQSPRNIRLFLEELTNNRDLAKRGTAWSAKG